MRPLVLSLSLIALLVAPTDLLAQAGPECQPDHPDRSNLVGVWTWVHTYDIHSGDSTPLSTGIARELHFREDGTVIHYENEVAVQNGSWCLRPCTPDEIFGTCGGQVVIGFTEYCNPFPSVCQWDYLFCPAAGCSNVGPDLVDGLQLRAMDHSEVIRGFERVSVVSTRADSWSTLKAQY